MQWPARCPKREGHRLSPLPLTVGMATGGPSALLPLDLFDVATRSASTHSGVAPPYRPRYCILDQNFTANAELFESQLALAVEKRRLWEFLAYDRIQDTAGSRQLSLSRKAYMAAKCPAPSSIDEKTGECVRGELPQKRHASWQCDLPYVNWWHPWNPSANSPVDELEHGIWQRACRYDNKDSPLDWYDRPIRMEAPAGSSKAVWLALTAVYNLTSEIKQKLEIPDQCHMEGVMSMTPAKPANQAAERSKLILSDRDGPWLSQLPRLWDLGQWRKRFHTIFIEPKDVHSPGFETYPKGFTASYMVGREEQLLEAVKSGSRNMHAKRGVLAAWGRRGGQTNHTVDSLRLESFVQSWETTRNLTGRGSTRIDERDLPADQYFAELSKYRFLLAPRGNGVQSPKFMEALLVGTIPITKRYAAFEDLVDYGFPMVLVDEWDDITPKALEQWWEELSPRMIAARWLATVDGMESLLFGECGAPPSSGGCRCTMADNGTLDGQGLWARCQAKCLRKLKDIEQQMTAAKKSSRGLTRTSTDCQDLGLPPLDTPIDSNRRVLKRVFRKKKVLAATPKKVLKGDARRDAAKKEAAEATVREKEAAEAAVADSKMADSTMADSTMEGSKMEGSKAMAEFAAKEKVATDLAEMERKLEMQSQAAEAAAKQHAAEMPAMDNKTSSDLVRDLTKHLREVSARAKALASNLSNLTNHNASVVASILASNSALAGAAAAAVKAASLAARNQTE